METQVDDFAGTLETAKVHVRTAIVNGDFAIDETAGVRKHLGVPDTFKFAQNEVHEKGSILKRLENIEKAIGAGQKVVDAGQTLVLAKLRSTEYVKREMTELKMQTTQREDTIYKMFSSQVNDVETKVDTIAGQVDALSDVIEKWKEIEKAIQEKETEL